MKTLSSLLFLALALALVGCSQKQEPAAPPPPAMKMNGQNVPSEGAHYMQQMKQGQQAPNGGR